MADGNRTIRDLIPRGVLCILVASTQFVQFDGPTVRAGEPTPRPSYGPARQLCDLAESRIHESSGLAVSQRNGDRFWTHNDSGDEARLFAFDSQGRHLGTYRLLGVQADDWEDMGSFSSAEGKQLFVGDIGDNSRRRSRCQIHIFEEPANPDGGGRVQQTLEFRYPDGPCDCEALAFDVARNEFLLVEKRFALQSRVYVLPREPQTRNEPTIARRIGSIPVPMVTSLDISPDGRRAIVATYGSAYEFSRTPNETWQDAIARAGRLIELPPRAQGEAICYGRDGITLFLTSEKRPCPLFIVPPRLPMRD